MGAAELDRRRVVLAQAVGAFHSRIIENRIAMAKKAKMRRGLGTGFIMAWAAYEDTMRVRLPGPALLDRICHAERSEFE